VGRTEIDSHGGACYLPFVHLPTGGTVMIPALIDPLTGERRVVGRIHPDIVPVHDIVTPGVDTSASGPFGWLVSMWRTVMECVRIDRPSSHHSGSSPATPAHTVRRLDFDQHSHDDAEVSSESEEVLAKRFALPTATLAGFRSNLGSLELHNINDFLTDIKAAVGRSDADAHALMSDPQWRTNVNTIRAVRANKRIAAAIDGALDKSADGVMFLLSRLRKSERTDRPGVLYSGMDILEEIEALVTERSLGEIKLNKDAVKDVAFEAGAGIVKSRLVADAIEKYHALKPAGERAVVNSIFHEIISKIPTSGDGQLQLKKEKYEDDLYKSEMRRSPPPWTLAELVDDIAVDLARASPVRELSAVDKHAGPKLHSTYACSNCGGVGGHLSKDCPAKCASCKFNFCPGAAQQKVCAVLCDVRPSLRTETSGNPITNFNGRPLFQFLMDKLEAAWVARHEK